MFIFCNSFGQINKLDTYNGFKHFKFGKPISTFKNLKLKKSPMNFKNVITYDYIGTDIKDFSGVPIEEITLQFFNNKLFKITVNFSDYNKNDYSLDEFNLVKMVLTSNFGDPIECQTADPTIINCAIWDSKNVRLDNIRLKTNDNPNRIAMGYILFIDKNLDSQQQASELN